MDVLQRLAPVSERYASLPVPDAFNWADASSELGDGDWYLVAFRSMRKPGADEERLTAYDEAAHREAAAANGFIHYFKGPAGPDGSCLSFCLWQTRADARAAAGRPDHVRAVSLIDEMYASYTLEFLRVSREAGGPLAFEPYDGAPVHGAAEHVHVVGPGLDPVDAPVPLLPANPAPAF
jgi:hypothetical protein